MRVTALGLLGLIVASPPAASADACIHYGNYPREIWFTATPGVSQGLELAGDFAYVADGSAGLSIYDISNRTPVPSLVSTFPGFNVRDVQVLGTLAYLAAFDDGLVIVDVTDHANPTFVGSVPFDEASHLQVVGSHAYVACGAEGFRVIDVTVPAAPVPVGFADPVFRVHQVVVIGSWAYLAARSPDGLLPVDVANPAAPAAGTVVPTATEAMALHWTGSELFLGSRGELHRVDLSVPSAPLLTASAPAAPVVNAIDVADGIAYLANGIAGVALFDVSGPTPAVIGSVGVTGNVRDVALSGSTLFVMNSNFSGVDVTHPEFP